jgi:hypothetical protein
MNFQTLVGRDSYSNKLLVDPTLVPRKPKSLEILYLSWTCQSLGPCIPQLPPQNGIRTFTAPAAACRTAVAAPADKLVAMQAPARARLACSAAASSDGGRRDLFLRFMWLTSICVPLFFVQLEPRRSLSRESSSL